MRVDALAPPDADTTDLAALVSRREQLLQLRQQERNRLELAQDLAAKDIKAHIKQLERRIKKMEKACAELLAKAPALAERVKRLAAMRGIGTVTATTLVAFLPELGQLSHAQITAMAGLAPWSCDSGAKHGRRAIRGGRGRVRRALYMAAMTAAQHKPGHLGRYYHRLRHQQNKPGKVALVACMRKLIIMANAVVKREAPWQECAPGPTGLAAAA